MIDETLGSYDVSVKYGDEIIESYNIDVLAIDPQWIKSQTSSWLNGEISDYSDFKKIVLQHVKAILLLPRQEIIEPIYISNNKILS